MAAWTPERDEQLRELHAAGKTLHAIHTETGWAKGSISAAARRLGLAWDRARTEQAVRSRKAVCADLRARLEQAYLEEAEKLLGELRKPHLAYSFGGKDNTYEERLHPEPDAVSKLKLVQASGAALDRALKIDQHATSASVEGARSMLAAWGAALGLGPADPPPPPEPGDGDQ